MADEPSKYRMTFSDRDGNEESHYVVQVPDPGTADKVKEHILKTRADLTLRGVNENNLNIVKVGPQTPADLARVGSILSGADLAVKK